MDFLKNFAQQNIRLNRIHLSQRPLVAILTIGGLFDTFLVSVFVHLFGKHWI